MTTKTLVIILAMSCMLMDCAGMDIQNLETRLNQTSDPSQLAALADDAATKAQQESDLKNRVTFSRIAAVAAWQAGEAGKSRILAISNAGIAACESLPNKDQDAPRDCSQIRLALPLAVQDELARDLRRLQDKRTQLDADHQEQCRTLAGEERTRCLASRAKLPAADLQPVQQLFDGFETQFGKISGIRSSLKNLPVPETFISKTDRQRLIVYCNAVQAWSLSADVEGTSPNSFATMAARKKAVAERLESESVPTDCRNLATTTEK